MRDSRVLYCHGLESGPNGYKVRALRERGLDVVAPALQMSLWNPTQKNSLLRSLLSPKALFSRAPMRWLAGAMDDSFLPGVHRRDGDRSSGAIRHRD